nr:methyltransferase [Candidatus Hydrogenedentota bacterium]
MVNIGELTGRINDLATGFRQSAILYAAVEADVFSLFTPGRKTAEEMATALGWDRRGARIFLDALVALELLDKHDGAYGNTPVSAACLVPG